MPASPFLCLHLLKKCPTVASRTRKGGGYELDYLHSSMRLRRLDLVA
ncbi:hypothetical protein VBJFXLJN_CDS_0028 [Pseudomonas phage TIVP-H6]